MRQRDPCEEVARRLHERDREHVAARPDPRDVPGLAGEERGKALDRGRLARPAPAAAELRRERPLERVLERRRRHGLVRRRREAEAFADAEGVGAAVRGDARHRGGNLGAESLARRPVRVGVREQPRTRRRLQLLVRGRVREPGVQGQIRAGKRQPQLGPAGRGQRRRLRHRARPDDAAGVRGRGRQRTHDEAPPGARARVERRDRPRGDVRDPEPAVGERDPLWIDARNELAPHAEGALVEPVDDAVGNDGRPDEPAPTVTSLTVACRSVRASTRPVSGSSFRNTPCPRATTALRRRRSACRSRRTGSDCLRCRSRGPPAPGRPRSQARAPGPLP